MYVSRWTPPNLHTPQLEIDNGQDGAGGPLRAELLIVVAVSALGLTIEWLSPGALAYIASTNESLNLASYTVGVP